MVGENLRLGQGFTIRGYFHAALPPIYPVFVAAAHTLGGPARFNMLCWNSAAICLIVFPVFFLARHFRLSVANSYLLAAAGAFLPHTFYASMYMAESLQYPLALNGFYLSAKWLENQSWRRDVALGLALAAALLNKLSEMSLLTGFTLTVVIVALMQRDKRARFSLHAVVVFGIIATLELAWLAWKNTHGGSALGHYGSNFDEAMRMSAPYTLLLAYIGDFLLAPGLIVAVPLLYWFGDNWRNRRALALLLLFSLSCQIGFHSFFEARLTGILRERLFLYSFILIAIAAVAGVDVFKRRQQTSLIARYIALPYVPLLLLALVNLTTFGNPPPGVDAPWVALMGSLNRHAFITQQFLLVTTAAILLGSTLLLLVPARPAASLFAVGILGFYVAGFTSSAAKMALWSKLGTDSLQPLLNWLDSSGAKPGSRLVMAATPWVFEGHKAFEVRDKFLESWIASYGPYMLLSVQLESLGRYDVRSIIRLEEIPELMRPGDHLFATTRFSQLPLSGQIYPYFLYAEPAVPPESARPLYSAEFPAPVLPSVPFMPGRYRVTPHIKGSDRQESSVIDVPRESRLSFAKFDGLTVEFVAGEPAAALPPLRETRPFVPELRVLADDRMPSRANCALDSLNGIGGQPEFHIHPADGLAVSGSEFDGITGSSSGPLLAELTAPGHVYSAAAERQKPPGFRLQADIHAVPPGHYHLTMVQLEPGGPIQCSTFWNVIVDPVTQR